MPCATSLHLLLTSNVMASRNDVAYNQRSGGPPTCPFYLLQRGLIAYPWISSAKRICDTSSHEILGAGSQFSSMNDNGGASTYPSHSVDSLAPLIQANIKRLDHRAQGQREVKSQSIFHHSQDKLSNRENLNSEIWSLLWRLTGATVQLG